MNWEQWQQVGAEDRIKAWQAAKASLDSESIINIWTEQTGDIEVAPMNKTSQFILQSTIEDGSACCDYCQEMQPHVMIFPDDDEPSVEAKALENLTDGYGVCAWCIVAEKAPKCVNCGVSESLKHIPCSRWMGDEKIVFDSHDFQPNPRYTEVSE